MGTSSAVRIVIPDRIHPVPSGLWAYCGDWQRALLGGALSEGATYTPGWQGNARGMISGIAFATTPLEILRAGLESVALRIAEVYQLFTLLALRSLGQLKTLEEFHPPIGSTFEPDLAAHELYLAAMQEQRNLYEEVSIEGSLTDDTI